MLTHHDKTTSVVVIGFVSFFVGLLVKEYILNKSKKGKKKIEEKDKLLQLLQSLDDAVIDKEELVAVLNNLLQLCAYVQIQVRIHDLGYLHKIAKLLNHSDREVIQAATLVINNLSLNEQNQAILKNYIPTLIHILKTTSVVESNITLFVAVLNALTNLTTLDGSHHAILAHIGTLCEILQQCQVKQIKLLVLRIMVNLSTNNKICENLLEVDAQLLRTVEPYISINQDERHLVRALSCCANVLTSIHRRWRNGEQPCVTVPEFVSERLHDNLVKLTCHTSQEVRLQCRRALEAMRSPLTIEPLASLDNIDILDVLKI